MPNKNPITWILVADNCKASFYRVTKFPKIEEISSLEHPEGRLHDRDLVTERPGRGFQSVGNRRHSYEPEVGPKQQESIKFAIEVAHFLYAAENKGEFHRLYIISEPSFLGLLRQHLNQEVIKLVVAQSPKKLTASDLSHIENHLAELSPGLIPNH